MDSDKGNRVTMKTLTVDLGERSYPIYMGPKLLDNPQWLLPHIAKDQVLIVSNETVAPLYLARLTQMLDASPLRYQTVILPDGESYKTLDTMNQIFTALLENRLDRGVTLIALGGGVIGDMTGFAAACYQRGVAFIQIPTTLLAQVDSSVGGKTGVNHPLGKNMIGAFHQPRCVIADTDTLTTLEDRQLKAGLAEVIKYGLIRDHAFARWLADNRLSLLQRDPQALTYVIERSCQIKADIVKADEKERGERALLNLGHTFGHAIETSVGYGEWLHGEAIAVGMVMAARFSAELGWLDTEGYHGITRLIQDFGLPIHPPADLGSQPMLERMAVDKKVQEGRLRLVLLKALGKAVVTHEFDPEKLRKVLIAICGK